MIPISKPIIKNNEIEAVVEVLKSGNIAQGDVVENFENRFAAYIGTKYAVATTNGTSALHTALSAAGLQQGDEVITTPFSFVASANSIIYCGAKPVFSDVNISDFNLNVNLIENSITDRTKAILVVHLYGQPAEMEKLIELCQKYKILLVEDACQAHGAKYNGRRVGGLGDLGCFSFYPTKNITTGEGGMVTTNNKSFYEHMKMFRNHGQSSRYHQDILGFNYRMTNINAAIGVTQLDRLDEYNEIRVENANYLISNLKDIPGLQMPNIFPERKSVFHQFTIRVLENSKLNRDRLHGVLSDEGIGCGVYYPVTIPAQKYYKEHGYSDNYPIASILSKQVLSLPVGPHVTKQDLNKIVTVMRSNLL